MNRQENHQEPDTHTAIEVHKTFDPIHYAPVISYLKATGCQLGLLINFNVPLLKSRLKRVVLT